MRLYVTDNVPEDRSFDVIYMSTSEFNCAHNHLFIASSKFDEVLVEVTPKIKIGTLMPMIGSTKIIPLITEVNNHAISLLSELCKDRAAQLRFTYIRDKEACKELVNSMIDEYGWRRFYN